MHQDANKNIARRLRRSSRTILFLAALRGLAHSRDLVVEAGFQLAEAERLSPTRAPS